MNDSKFWMGCQVQKAGLAKRKQDKQTKVNPDQAAVNEAKKA
jgi:hypothetical protein